MTAARQQFRATGKLALVAAATILAGCNQHSGADAKANKVARPSPTRQAENLAASGLDPRWQELVDDCRLFQLPLPPKTALLVEYSSLVGGETCVGFRLDSPRPVASGPVILAGSKRYRPRSPISDSLPEGFRISEISGDRPSAKSGLGVEGTDGPFELNTAIATAVQCKLRGLHRIADRLLSVAMKEPGCEVFSLTGSKPTPRLILTQMAWGHWCEELGNPGSDRANILSRLRVIRSRLGTTAGKRQDLTIAGLELNLKAAPGAPESIESMVDALADMTDLAGFPEMPDGRDHVPYNDAIAALGFDAAPVLLRHIDDRRLTRIVAHGRMNRLPYVMRVGGFGEIFCKLTPCYTTSLGYGIDNPRDRDLGTIPPNAIVGQRARNEKYWLNFIWKLSNEWETRFEVSHLKTTYIAPSRSSASMLYHELVRYSF